MPGLEDAVLPEDLLERVGIEVLIFGDHIDQARQIGEEVSLVPVGQDSRHSRIVEFDILVVDLDEVDIRVLRNKWPERLLNHGRNLALWCCQ